MRPVISLSFRGVMVDRRSGTFSFVQWPKMGRPNHEFSMNSGTSQVSANAEFGDAVSSKFMHPRSYRGPR